MKLRTQVVFSCLIACCLFCFSSLFAQGVGQIAPASDENVELQPQALALTDSGPSETETTVADTLPSQDPQSQGQGVCCTPTPAGRAKPGPGAVTTKPYVFPTSGEMNRFWLRNTLGPKAWIGGAFTASWNQWVSNSPSQWESDGNAWLQRFGSALLDNGINTTSLVWISRWTHQDPRYRRCDCTGLKPRAWHATKLAFMSFNRNGDTVFSPAKMIAPFTGPLVTRNFVYPANHDTKDALHGGPYYFIGSIAWNLVREFFVKF
jgi:hypothetical protein